MFIPIFLISLLTITKASSSSKEEFHLRIKYRYFDDYLTSMDVKEQAYINGDRVVEISEGSGEVDETHNRRTMTTSLMTRKLPIRTGATRSKETTCCMLGQLAGDKGYHCFAKFYAARIMFRNYNRAHNKKIAGLQSKYASRSVARNPIKDSAEKLMRTFSQCVTHRALIFHKCCHLSAMEKDPVKLEKGQEGRLVSNRVR